MTKQLNWPKHASKYPLLAVDWGKKLTVTKDGTTLFAPLKNTRKRSRPFNNLIELFDYLKQHEATEKYRIVIESTFESYFANTKNEMIKRAEDDGHVLKTVAPRSTASIRNRSEKKIVKTDKNDVMVIWKIANEGKKHLAAPRKAAPRVATLHDRIQFYRRTDKLRFPNKKISEIPEIAEIQQKLPYSSLSPEHKRFLGNGKNYDKIIMIPYEAAKTATSRKEYEKLLGLYEHGYPSYFRSTICRRIWDSKNQKLKGYSWTEYRKCLRMCYHKLK